MFTSRQAVRYDSGAYSRRTPSKRRCSLRFLRDEITFSLAGNHIPPVSAFRVFVTFPKNLLSDGEKVACGAIRGQAPAAISLRRFLPCRGCSVPARRRCDTDAPFRTAKEKPARRLTEECRSVHFSCCSVPLRRCECAEPRSQKSDNSCINSIIRTTCPEVLPQQLFPSWE